jgi:hypothetical protein
MFRHRLQTPAHLKRVLNGRLRNMLSMISLARRSIVHSSFCRLSDLASSDAIVGTVWPVEAALVTESFCKHTHRTMY